MKAAIAIADGKLSLKGPLDFESVPELSTGLAEALKESGDLSKLDLSAVERVDSAGLSLLLSVRRLSGRLGRELTVSGASPQLRALAQANKLDTILGLS